MANRTQATPWWVTAGCGCCGLFLLALGAIVAAGYLGVSAVKDYVEDLKDPAARAVKAGQILGASELPAGYSAQVYLRIPWVFDLVILSDGEPAVMEGDEMELEPKNFGEHVFVFFTLRQGSMDEEEIDDMLQGRRTKDGVEIDVGFEVDVEQQLAEGAFEIGAQRISYIAYRGDVLFEGDPEPGIFSRILFDCEGDQLTRAGVWLRREAAVSEDAVPNTVAPNTVAPNTVAPNPMAGDTLELSGSPADEASLREFLGHFDVCND